MKSIMAVGLMLAGIIWSNAAHAGDYLVTVYCNGEPPRQVVVTVSAVNYAVKAAERQNPGCKVVFSRKVD
ncbi:hypothetical protein RYZ26_18365 [Terasakiella sp. A23]|uniref:hypothetical protein n=1 Tax=Terasakiella sp. FCG-A23 TaxID=3080561 RepID=UPI00295412F3|nr:hypothetical protein [Terasakiella sp. A23]MDV7341575.1 hypothetical protein [Terasakiella sp. A23]